jgi:hypothetical protein
MRIARDAFRVAGRWYKGIVSLVQFRECSTALWVAAVYK